MNATKMCSVALNRFPHMLWFDVSIKRMKKGKKIQKQNVRCVYFTQQLPSFAMAFFHLFVNIFCTINSPILFFIFSIDGYKNDFLFTSLVFLCEFILCVLCLQQSTHLERQLVQPMVSFEMYTCCFFVVDVIC